MSIGGTRRTTKRVFVDLNQKGQNATFNCNLFLSTTTPNSACADMKLIGVTQTTNFFTVALEKKQRKKWMNWTSNRAYANELRSHETSDMLFLRRELTRHRVWHLKIATRNVLGASRWILRSNWTQTAGNDQCGFDFKNVLGQFPKEYPSQRGNENRIPGCSRLP